MLTNVAEREKEREGGNPICPVVLTDHFAKALKSNLIRSWVSFDTSEDFLLRFVRKAAASVQSRAEQVHPVQLAPLPKIAVPHE